MPKWIGTFEAAKRLRSIGQTIPGGNIGGGSQSATVAGIASYARDVDIYKMISIKVLNALAAPNPHPTFGDDGYQSEMREDAIEALIWGESWIQWRVKHGWTSADRTRFGDTPWIENT